MNNAIDILENAAHNISEAAKDMEQKREELDRTKQNEKVAIAKVTILYQDSKNQKILEAYITSNKDVQNAVNCRITAQGDYEKAKIEHDRQNNLFISARKIASLDEKELAMISGSIIKIDA